MLSPDVQRRAAVLQRWMGVVALLSVTYLVWVIVKVTSWKGYLPLTAVLDPLAWVWLLYPLVVGFSLVKCGCEGATGNESQIAMTMGWSMVCFVWSLFMLGALLFTGGPFARRRSEIPDTYRDLGILLAFQVATVVVFAGAYFFATRLGNSLKKPTALVTTSPGFHMRLESPQDQWRSARLARPVDTSVPREAPQAMPLAAAV